MQYFGRSLPSASFHILHSSRESPLSSCLHWTSRAPKSLAISASSNPSRTTSRASTIPSPPVQDPLAATRSPHAPSSQLPHNPHAFHSPLRCPCGSLGKSRSHLPLHVPVFQFSSFPQPRFRKLSPIPTPRPHAISPSFPLFLPHLRVLLSFIYLYPYLSSPSRRHTGHLFRSVRTPSSGVVQRLPHPFAASGERVGFHSQPRVPRTGCINGSVKGHDFSRAAKSA
jgi:hypothetical protein